MEEKICYYCGTKYPKDMDRCPVCDQKETVAEEIDEIPADLKPSAQEKQPEEEPVYRPRERRKKRRRKNVFATILCILLALAVVACVLWILNSIGVISLFHETPTDDTSLSLPVETQPAGITGISVSPEQMQFTAGGQKKRISVNYLSEDGSAADPAVKLAYLSENPEVAAVSEDGEVTAVGAGTTTVTVCYDTFSAVTEVICDFEPGAEIPGAEMPEKPEDQTKKPDETKPDDQTEKPAETKPEDQQEKPEQTKTDASFALSLSDFTLFSAGEKAKIGTEGVPSGAEIVWSSKDASVASVKDGTVTAVGPGMTTVTATYGGQTLSCIVRCSFDANSAAVVTETDDGVSISHEDVTLMRPDERFTVSLLKGDAGVSGVTWSTTDSSVCSVDPDGTVHAKGTGTAKIIGKYNGNSYSCIVRCRF